MKLQDASKKLLTRLWNVCLELKPSKCHFARSSIRFLGNIVSRDGVATDPEKTQNVADRAIPRNVTEVRAFVGVAS